MTRIFVIIPALIVLLGISDVAFAKHHHHHYAQDDKKNKVPCLVKGVQQMVESEDACKDLAGTIVADQNSHDKTAESKKNLAMSANVKSCAEDTFVDKFGDWSGNLFFNKATKKWRIARRKANRLAKCVEKYAQKMPEVVKKPDGNIKS